MKVGDYVRSFVWVGADKTEMHVGRIESLSPDGTVAYVDRMGLHGGKPWVLPEATKNLEVIQREAR